VLSNSFGFGGHNAVLLLRSYDRRSDPSLLIGHPRITVASAALDVDSMSLTGGASRLYERAGMHVERALDSYDERVES
jgi:hypothetical protein